MQKIEVDPEGIRQLARDNYLNPLDGPPIISDWREQLICAYGLPRFSPNFIAVFMPACLPQGMREEYMLAFGRYNVPSGHSGHLVHQTWQILSASFLLMSRRYKGYCR
ncbi:hypothetical protein TNCV_4102991 [Trichonephila clavipes]|nr:hypothetical protein TNCV_4102991 [Trichonephila clavipes]